MYERVVTYLQPPEPHAMLTVVKAGETVCVTLHLRYRVYNIFSDVMKDVCHFSSLSSTRV